MKKFRPSIAPGVLSPKPLSACLMALGLLSGTAVWADTAPQILPFTQDWTSPGLISADDDWSGVPGIFGYRGDLLTSATGADPQTLLLLDSVTDVNANQTAPNTFATGGVTEFQLSNPTIALAGSGTADAPSIVIHLDTTGQQAIQVSYLLRDLDGSTDDATQQVALQYRVGTSGNFINVPAGYVADATSGPSLATLVTAVNATLPSDAANQPLVQVRIITTNAVGNDEWVGIDDISVTGTPLIGEVNQSIAATCPAGAFLLATAGGSVAVSATDPDSVVNAITLTSTPVPGISLGPVNASSGNGGTGSASVVFAPGVEPGIYTLQLKFENDEAQEALCSVTVTASGSATIPQIQGPGVVSPLVGLPYTTRGVVTKRLNNGYFMQDPAGDGQAATSDGIFVFTGGSPSVAVGDDVEVSGTVAEFAPGGANAAYQPATQLGNVTATNVISNGNFVSPTVITLPEVVEGELERFEGMLVTINSPLTASQNFFQGRFGQVTLSAEGRLIKPTNQFPAGSGEAIALADDNARRRILLDDGTSLQNPNPTPYLGADNTLRAGDTLPNGITGVIDYGLATASSGGISDYRIHPTEAVSFVRSNPRPAAPAPVGGNVRVGSFNVLNYFTTIDQTGAACFPRNGRSDCRGADSAAEFTRQVNKIVPAILGLNADVVGLIEIENNGNVAVQDLVDRLNMAVGAAGTYASVGMPTGGTGGDAIRVAMIYKPARVSLSGGAVSDTAGVHNRPPLAQTFALTNGEKFTVVVNHFKSKGCDRDSDPTDFDQGDGQGCFNPTRVAQSQALLAFVDTLTATDPDVLVVGDLNAYGKEDPILALTSAGFVDELARRTDAPYSYVFDGEAGVLDHALATPSLSAVVTGATVWPINADEPSIIDYETSFKVGDTRCGTAAVPTCSPDNYFANPYRSSDHDPVLVGLSLVKNVQGTAGRDTLVGTPGDDRITGGSGADVVTGGAGADTFVYDAYSDAGDRITDFVPGTDKLDLSGVLQSIGYTGTDAIGDGFIRLVDTPDGLIVQIDIDGNAGPSVARPRPLVTLTGVTVAQINPARDFGL